MNPETATQEIRESYRRYTLTNTIRNSKVACALVMVLMPAGYVMDKFVFPDQAGTFLLLRLSSSVLGGILLVALSRPNWSETTLRILCAGWYVIPSVMICAMIAQTKGLNSTYYAGLNLVILAVSSVIQATLWESLVAVIIILLLYIAACAIPDTPFDHRMAFNNGFFLFCTSAIVITGNYFYNNLRFREFTLRYELDRNKRELEDSNRKLIELDQLKSHFFANVSHELRTPLTLLLAPLESLIRKYKNSMDSSDYELLMTMRSSGMRLLKLINDLLDLIRLESGRMQVKSEPIALPDFVNGLASAVRQFAANKKITLETLLEPTLSVILSDRDKLEKILLNLLFNALKFTPEEGHVWLKVRRESQDLVFVVSDTGVGIAEKNLPSVFARFWQEDGSSKRKFQGVGIGLALVKELAELQNGTASVESREGHGATFTIRLPYREARAVPESGATVADPEPVASEEWLVNLYRRAELFPAIAAVRETNGNTPFVRRTQRPLVLVADDEPEMRRFLVSQLNEEYEVMEAVDGLEAISQAQSALPDLMLCDLMMPQKDGLEVCKELRANSHTSGIPVILLTARADEDAKFDALQMGANDFLAKPFSSVELQARVKNLIERHRFQQHLARQNEALSKAIEQIKETEMQLVQSEKMSSLGRFSAGLMHDILNPLNYARTGLFVLRKKARKLPPDSAAETDTVITDIEDGLRRVDEIVSGLRTFTHPGGQVAEELDLAETFKIPLQFVANDVKEKNISLKLNLLPGQKVWASRNNLITVIVNLLENAIDALGEKQFTNGSGPLIEISSRVEGDRSLIVFHDNGPGITQENLSKVFDPFFTTKDIGKGTGLGLSICFGIVRGYGGNITAASNFGQFCEFTLDLPATAAPTANTAPEHA